MIGRALGSLRTNPVLRLELLNRVQGGSAVIFLTIWLGLLMGILALTYQANVAISNDFGFEVTQLGRIGRSLFEWVLFGMTLLVLFLVPGLTAGTVTGERERQTLVPLQMTLMRPSEIIVGKLAAALAFILLLILAALPLLAVSVLVGGVRALDVVRGVSMLAFVGLVLGGVCVWISSKMKRTMTATVVSYATTLLFAIGSFVIMAVLAIIDGVRGNDNVDPSAIPLIINPFAAIGDALPSSNDNFFNETVSPFGATRSATRDLAGGLSGWLWVCNIVVGLILLVIVIRRATKAVTTPADTER